MLHSIIHSLQPRGSILLACGLQLHCQGWSSPALTSKMWMPGWWMVMAMALPVWLMLRTTRITMAAARASRPAHDRCNQVSS